VTTRDNQRPAHPTNGNNNPTTPTHRQPDEPNTSNAPNAVPTPPHHSHNTAPTDNRADSHPRSPQRTVYIRHIADTAPAPTPAQLERLAGLLRNPGNPSTPN
jgi:hypothetical protein